MKIRRYDYAEQLGPGLSQLILDIERMLKEGNYILSREVVAFENAFANYLGTNHVCGVNSGTDALVLALHALNVGHGDEVITQANTFHATVAAICTVGATPVLVDADSRTFQMDWKQIEEVTSARTKAIIPVHLYGKPAPMHDILPVARKHGLFVIEDAAQAHGAKLDGRQVGTWGEFGCFSFHPSKNLAAAGDAGAVCTNASELCEQIQILRGLGQSGQNNHVRIGLNSKLDAIQARILSEKLPRLDRWNQERRRVAAMYQRHLEGCPVEFQSGSANEEHVYHLFQIRSTKRDQLLHHLNAQGVEATVRYPVPIHLQPAFDRYEWRLGQFPVAESLANELLCLPIRPEMSEAEVDYVSKQIRQVLP